MNARLDLIHEASLNWTRQAPLIVQMSDISRFSLDSRPYSRPDSSHQTDSIFSQHSLSSLHPHGMASAPNSPTRPSPNDLQSHLYASFLQRKTADVALRISGSWHAVYRLHRVILIQAVCLILRNMLQSASHLPVRAFSSRCSPQVLASQSRLAIV